MNRLMLLGVAALLLSAAGASAQSLAEVARQEKARRAALAEESKEGEPKVYTRADLRPAGWLTSRAGDPPPAAPAVTTPAADEDETPDGETEPAGEEAWRSRIQAARDGLERAQLMAAALQNRVDGLWAEFTARDDPAQRATIDQERQTALQEIERTNQEIETLTQQIADIEAEARRAGVPPGWLRE